MIMKKNFNLLLRLKMKGKYFEKNKNFHTKKKKTKNHGIYLLLILKDNKRSFEGVSAKCVYERATGTSTALKAGVSEVDFDLIWDVII